MLVDRPEMLRMSELSDNQEIQAYSTGVLYILSALTPLSDFVDPTLDKFVEIIQSSTVTNTPFDKYSSDLSCTDMEDASERSPSPGHLLLQEPTFVVARACVQGDAGAHRLPRERERGGQRDGLEGPFGCDQNLTAPEYHPTQGRPTTL